MLTGLPGLALEVRDVSKTFPGQLALDHFDFDVRFGEIHALAGENGSGKSTLIKCIAGYHTPDPGGSISLANRLLDGGSRRAGRIRGVAFVHQDLGILPDMTVAENLSLGSGFDVGRARSINWGAEERRASEALMRLGCPDIDPDIFAGQLSASSQAIVALARAFQTLGDEPGLIVLDEVTAALPEREVMKLFETLGSITRHGSAVLMVSHRLREIFAIANRVTVIRDGRKVRTCAVSEIDKAGLTALIIGRDLDAFVPTAAQPLAGRCLLRTSGLRGRRLKTVDIAVDRGEIVGVTGLLGSGKSELLRILYGAEKRLGGVIQMEGESISFSSPRDGVVHGIGYVPSDRLRGGGFGELNLVENLTVGSLTTARRKFYIGPSKESRGAKTLMEQYGIQPPHPLRQFSTLSGGNQQKLILARVIGLRPRLLLLDEPTQGVDVGAKAEIYQIIRDVAADEGAGVVLASSDAEELVELCHKIVVLDQGRLSAVLQGAAVTEDQLQNAIYGSTGAASA